MSAVVHPLQAVDHRSHRQGDPPGVGTHQRIGGNKHGRYMKVERQHKPLSDPKVRIPFPHFCGNDLCAVKVCRKVTAPLRHTDSNPVCPVILAGQGYFSLGRIVAVHMQNAVSGADICRNVLLHAQMSVLLQAQDVAKLCEKAVDIGRTAGAAKISRFAAFTVPDDRTHGNSTKVEKTANSIKITCKHSNTHQGR